MKDISIQQHNDTVILHLYKYPQYSALETGVPCLALDDVIKLVIDERNEIKKGINCGLVFTGNYDENGRPDFIGTTEEWKKFNKLT